MKNDKDDISFDDDNLDDSVVAEEAAAETIKKLRGKLKEAEVKAKEYLDGWQRAQADFANLRKRDEEEKKEFAKYANTKVVEELMPVLDALSLAVSHGEKGVEPIQSLLLKTLRNHGLEETNPVGEMFDPRLHESVGAVETNDKKDEHKILEVMQKGYILQGKILRPAKVKIGEYKE